MEITATFKHQKMHPVNEGFDPEITPEPLCFMHEPAYSCIPSMSEILNSTIQKVNFKYTPAISSTKPSMQYLFHKHKIIKSLLL